MSRILRTTALFVLACIPALPQSGLLPGYYNPQFFDNSGNPLNGGLVYTCTAGSACPGTPRSTYTTATLFTQNQNPIQLNTAGRPSNGGSVVGIWLTPGLAYKFVVQNSSGSTIYEVDNVTGAAAGGTSSSNYWTLAGSTISNNNAGGSGTVAMGGQVTVGSGLTVAQTIGMKSSSTQYAYLRAANVMASDVTWRLPAADSAGCLSSDGLGNLSIAACGSGGSGTPGGVSTNIQYNDGVGFGGSANMTWNNGSQLLTVTATSASAAGIATTGFFQSVGGLVVTNACVSYNCIQSASAAGGMAARSFTATKYVQVGNNNGTPSVTTSDAFAAGALYWDTGTGDLQVYDGSGWLSLGAGSGSPGGPAGSVQFSSTTTPGAFAGDANMSWNPTLRRLTVATASLSDVGVAVTGGYIQSDAGFLANYSVYNTIQAPFGGMLAKSFTATGYIQSGNNGSGTSKPTATTNDTFTYGAMFYNVGNARMEVCASATCTGGAGGTGWVAIGGSGSGTPGSPDTSIQFNSSGSFTGSSSMTWDNTNKYIAVTPNSVGGVAFKATNGYVEADYGFLANQTNYNVIQAPSGGLYSRSVRAIIYSKVGQNSGTPTATTGDALTGSGAAGAMYWDTSGTPALKVYNGSAWVSVTTGAAGGVTSLNSLTGAVTLSGTANQVTVTTGGTITLSTPQDIATSSNPTFSKLTLSSSSGTDLTVGGLPGSQFIVSGGGAVTASTGLISSGSISSTSTAVNSIQSAGGVEACNGGACTSSSAFRINGTTVATLAGFWTGNVQIPAAGNFYGRYVSGASTGIFCSGVADGWQATTSDFYFVTCIGGVRYRSALAAY